MSKATINFTELLQGKPALSCGKTPLVTDSKASSSLELPVAYAEGGKVLEVVKVSSKWSESKIKTIGFLHEEDKVKVKVNVIYKYSEYEVGGKKYSLVDCVKLQTFELADMTSSVLVNSELVLDSVKLNGTIGQAEVELKIAIKGKKSGGELERSYRFRCAGGTLVDI